MREQSYERLNNYASTFMYHQHYLFNIIYKYGLFMASET